MPIKIEAIDEILRSFRRPPRQIDAEMAFEFGRARRQGARGVHSNQQRPQSEAEGQAAQADD